MLEIQLLGRFEISLDAQRVDLPSRPAQVLFAFLALNPGVAHRRERLAGLLWPDSNEANARRNLRQTLWVIRRALHPADSKPAVAASSQSTHQPLEHPNLIASDDLTITFNTPPNFTFDAALITQDVDRHVATDDLMRMLNAYRGELLPGVYDDWVILERERIHQQFERKINLLLDRLQVARNWDQTLHWGERWIALGGAPEPAFRALMSAHAALGDVSKAAEMYHRCVEAMQRELEVEPSQQTQLLFQQIRTGVQPALLSEAHTHAASTSLRQHNLPVNLTSFVGREQEMAEIIKRLSSTRLLTLTGTGGTGKTRLALQVAGQCLTLFPDGVWFIELATVTNPDLIPQTVAAVLDVREQPGYPLTRSLIDALRTRTLLLIMDNCEHIVDSCAAFAQALLRACANLKVLATSRETLDMAGESIFRVPPLALPDVRADQSASPDDLMRFASIKLFTNRATAVKPEFHLTPANASAVLHVCTQLEGIPLAIELAAARIRAMTIEQIAARLDDRFRLLTGGSRTAIPRQRTLRALIDWSWDLLSDPERILLRRLSIFIEGWSLEAAESICDLPSHAPGIAASTADQTILDTLTHLIEKSLVIVEEQGTTTRYSLLETIRQYALDKLLQSGEIETIRIRHLQYFHRLSDEAERELRAAGQIDWLARLETESGNLRAALTWAYSSQVAKFGLQLAGKLALFWYLRGYWNEGREWLRMMLDQHPLPNTAQEPEESEESEESGYHAPDRELVVARIHALCGAGWLADEDGSVIALYSEALSLSRETGDAWHEAYALRGIASSENVSDPEQAVLNLRRSRDLFRSLDDDWGTALAVYNLGWKLFDADDIGQAKIQWSEGLNLFRKSGDRWGIAVTQNALGYIARTDGDYPKAATLTHESLRLFRELGDKAGIAISLDRLANIALRRGDFVEAASLLKEALAISRASGNRASECALLDLSGLIHRYLGNFDQAEADLTQGLSIAVEFDLRADIPLYHNYLGLVAYDRGDLGRAVAHFQDAIATQIGAQNSLISGVAQNGLGMIALRQGDMQLASERLEESLLLFGSIGDRRHVAIARQDLGELCHKNGNRAAALAHMRESLALRRKLGDKHGLAQTFEGVASLLSVASKPLQAHAVMLLSAAHALRQTISAPVPPVERAEQEGLVNILRTVLGVEFESTWNQGSTLSVERAVRHALDGLTALEHVPNT